MRFFIKHIFIGWTCVAALSAYAQYEVTYTFGNGAQRTTDQLAVQDGKVVLAKENLQVPFDQVQNADFVFENPLPVEECETYIRQGAYSEMAARIDAFLAPVEQGLALRGNLDVYIQYKMRASFWAKKYEEALAAAQILRSKGSEYAPLAELYKVLISLEQGTPAGEVSVALAGISNSQEISGAMTEYILGRLRWEERDREGALQHFANVRVYHRRDAEWFPVATYYEGVVNKKTGYVDVAANIAEELKIAYPGGFWSARADELE